MSQYMSELMSKATTIYSKGDILTLIFGGYSHQITWHTSCRNNLVIQELRVCSAFTTLLTGHGSYKLGSYLGAPSRWESFHSHEKFEYLTEHPSSDLEDCKLKRLNKAAYAFAGKNTPKRKKFNF